MERAGAEGKGAGPSPGQGGLTAWALHAIRLYQRHISPRKGFCCAYRVHTGCASCSQLGYRAIRRFGLWSGLPVLRQRLHRCAVAHARFGAAPRTLPLQAGVCDLACDAPFGALDCDCLGLLWDVGDCALGSHRRRSTGCCGGWRRGGMDAADTLVHIPPDTRKHRRRPP